MIDINEVKAYNEELKKNKEKASMLTAQCELYEKELVSKCEELSKELGVTVTKDNLRQIYTEYEQKLRQTLETGRAVLQKIAQAEAASNAAPQNYVQNNVGVTQQVEAQNMGVQSMGTQNMSMQNIGMQQYNPLGGIGSMPVQQTPQVNNQVQGIPGATPFRI